MLILDEPTAALDPLAEFDLYTRFNELTAAKTTIFISHRLSSTRFCDRICFLENGRIREMGSHAELIALGGRYATLFELQARNYRANGDPDAYLDEQQEGENRG
jgi:ATP-binding cassette subfamily B protein